MRQRAGRERRGRRTAAGSIAAARRGWRSSPASRLLRHSARATTQRDDHASDRRGDRGDRHRPATRRIAQNSASTKRPIATDRPIMRGTRMRHRAMRRSAVTGLRAYRLLHTRRGAHEHAEIVPDSEHRGLVGAAAADAARAGAARAVRPADRLVAAVLARRLGVALAGGAVERWRPDPVAAARQHRDARRGVRLQRHRRPRPRRAGRADARRGRSRAGWCRCGSPGSGWSRCAWSGWSCCCSCARSRRSSRSPASRRSPPIRS